MSRIAVVCSDPDYVAGIRALSESIEAQIIDIGSNSGTENTTATGVMAQRPDAVLLGPEFSTAHRISMTEEIGVLHPHVVVLWVAEEDPSAWRWATQAGARDLLAPNATDERIVSQLRRATGIADSRRDRLQSVEGDTEEADLGRIISVVSPKGGSGKTMLSTNLAVGLAETAPNGVVLVDLDLQFGDVSTAVV